jgi:hypothetical protein
MLVVAEAGALVTAEAAAALLVVPFANNAAITSIPKTTLRFMPEITGRAAGRQSQR